jgi:hypothetical protein
LHLARPHVGQPPRAERGPVEVCRAAAHSRAYSATVRRSVRSTYSPRSASAATKERLREAQTRARVAAVRAG